MILGELWKVTGKVVHFVICMKHNCDNMVGEYCFSVISSIVHTLRKGQLHHRFQQYVKFIQFLLRKECLCLERLDWVS